MDLAAMLIPRRVLIASEPVATLSAIAAAGAIAGGLRAGGAPMPDILALEELGRGTSGLRAMLSQAAFDERLREARAVIVAATLLDEASLPDSATFEIATRARQAGVPAFAITARNLLDPFDARMLDLQLILEADDASSLSASGRRLARLV